MRAQYVSTSCSCTWQAAGHRGGAGQVQVEVVTSGVVYSGLAWSGRGSHELYKCFGLQLEHFCLTVRMIYVRRLFVQRVIERESERERVRESESSAHFRRNFRLDFLLSSAGFKCNSLCALWNCRKYGKRGSKGGREGKWEVEGGRRKAVASGGRLGKFIRVSRRTLPATCPLYIRS